MTSIQTNYSSISTLTPSSEIIISKINTGRIVPLIHVAKGVQPKYLSLAGICHLVDFSIRILDNTNQSAYTFDFVLTTNSDNYSVSSSSSIGSSYHCLISASSKVNLINSRARHLQRGKCSLFKYFLSNYPWKYIQQSKDPIICAKQTTEILNIGMKTFNRFSMKGKSASYCNTMQSFINI